jgi:hypothetical protein
MKKDRAKDQEQKPRRLSLNRETIRLLNDSMLLELARGGGLSQFGTDCRSCYSTAGCHSDQCI